MAALRWGPLLWLFFWGMCSELSHAASMALGDPHSSVDFTSFVQKDIFDLRTCQQSYIPTLVTSSGHRIKMLGAALVYLGPSNGRSLFGHVGERFVYCRDGELFDAFYDYAPGERTKIQGDIRDRLGLDLSTFSEELLSSYQGSLYVTLNLEPVKAYAIQQFHLNRSLFEAWFDTDENTLYQMLAANTKRYKMQGETIRRHEALPAYQLFGKNCTTPVQEDLGLVNPEYLRKMNFSGLTPSLLYKSLRKESVKKIIVYPSQRLFRLLRMKQEGESTLFEKIVPFSSASPYPSLARDNNSPTPWMLVYPEAESTLGQAVLSPLAGSVNLATAAVEMAYGVLTLPLTLLGQIPGFDFLRSPHLGFKRVIRGTQDLLASLGEILWIRTRYPHATPWSEDEKAFFNDLSQNAVLLEFLEAEYKNAPVVIEMATPR